jgi:L-fuculose-phosphate aldolase
LTDLAALAERVARACRVLGRLDLTHAAFGHVSARIPGVDRMLIRARGPGELGVRYTSAAQIIEVDFDGKLTRPNAEGLAVPQEVFIHAEIYRARPEIFSVIHIHPPTPMLFTICCKPLLPLYGAFDPPSAKLAIEGMPTYPRSVLINTRARGEDLARAMGQAKVCLMRGHGVTTAARSVEQATLYMVQLNQLADINHRAALLGGAEPISAEDQAEIAAITGLESRPANGEPPTGVEATNWRFFCETTGS